jgi:2-polyprenyl-3-methyl-5-hydroxy-6-metoxy-1,4-benzoquinol methylase
MTPQRWRDLSPDPNSKASRDLRRKTIQQAWRPPVQSRMEYLTQLAAGKRVLDVGVVCHVVDIQGEDEWMHGAISRSAASCLGVDILPEAIAELKARGFNVMFRDITVEPLDQTFELIVCGEVIEHVGSPAGLFKAAAKMLEPGGRLVLTTPNPYSDTNIRRALNGTFEESVDHVTLLVPAGIAELAEREGLVLDTYRGVSGQRLTKLRNRLRYAWSLRRHGGPATDRFSRRMIYECIKPV